MKIADARILITGGARGIGNFLANHLLEKAASVVVVDANEKLLAEIPNHKNLHKHSCDVTRPDDVRVVVEKVFGEQDGVNVLINNAGIIHNEPLINLLSRPDRKHKTESWNRVIDVNLNAVFYVTSNIVDQWVSRKEKGVIVNVSSISAQGNIGQSAYAASKAAVEALTKTWAKELAMFKIRSVCIAPGFFNTPSTRESLSENMLSKWEKSIPAGRLGELSELASAAEFLIGSDYFNGKILKLDGGLNL